MSSLFWKILGACSSSCYTRGHSKHWTSTRTATALSTEAANAVQMRVEANMMGANLGQTHVGLLLGACIQLMTYSPIFSSLGSRKVLSATET